MKQETKKKGIIKRRIYNVLKLNIEIIIINVSTPGACFFSEQ